MDPGDQTATAQPSRAAGPVRRLRRAERREQILDAATRAFARAGFAATSLDDVAAEAGITRVILYRHFESKAEMYRAVLARACTRLAQSVGTGDYDENAIPALLRAATAIARRDLAKWIPEGPWLDWAARLIPTLTLEAVLAWLDVGQPDPDQAADRIGQLVHHATQTAQAPSG